MAKCLACGRRGLVRVSYLEGYLCKYHFLKYFENRFYGTLERLVEGGERVVAAISGGKDSSALLYLLDKFSGRLNLEVVALFVDEGIAGYSDARLSKVRELCRSLGVELVVVGFEREYGASMDRLADRLGERGYPMPPCTLCGVLKRRLVNVTARALGADFVATGHNLDDEVQAFYMNLLKGNVANISRDLLTAWFEIEGMVPRIKPLYFAPEREVLAYAILRGLPFVKAACRYVSLGMRSVVRRLLNALEREEPGTKLKLLAMRHVMAAVFRGEARGTVKLGRCRICGEPSAHEVCKACELLSEVIGGG